MSSDSGQEQLSYEDAMRVLGYEADAIVSPHLPLFKKVAGKLEALVNSTKDDHLRKNFSDELYRLKEALRVVESERDREPSLRGEGMGLRLGLALLIAGILVAAAWYGNRTIEEGGYLRDREGIARLEAMARLAAMAWGRRRNAAVSSLL